MPSRTKDTFPLWDLRVEVIATDRPMVCHHQPGDSFELSGENLAFQPGQTFPIYALGALLAILPAKQRMTDPNDWMSTDTDVACPDPHCGARFRIMRLRKRTFRHAAVSAVPVSSPRPARRRRAPAARKSRLAVLGRRR